MGLRLENEALWGEGGEMMTSGHLGPAPPPAGHHSTPHYHYHHPGECSLHQSWRKTGAPVSLSLAAGRDRGESGNHQRQGTIAPALHYTTLVLSSGISYHNIWTSIQRDTRQGTTPRQTFCRGFWDPIRSTESIRYTWHLQNEYIFCFNLAKRFISGLGHKSLIQCSCYNV